MFGGDSRSVTLTSLDPIKVMVQRNGTDKLRAQIVYNGPLQAPIEPGKPVGVLKVWRGTNVAIEAPLQTSQSIGVGSTTRRAFDGVSELFGGLFRAGAAKL